MQPSQCWWLHCIEEALPLPKQIDTKVKVTELTPLLASHSLMYPPWSSCRSLAGTLSPSTTSFTSPGCAAMVQYGAVHAASVQPHEVLPSDAHGEGRVTQDTQHTCTKQSTSRTSRTLCPSWQLCPHFSSSDALQLYN